MILGKTLPQLAELVNSEKPLKRDFIVDTRSISMMGDPSIPTRMLMLTANKTEIEFTPRANFHGQLAERLGIPMAYYNRMKSDARELLTGNVNHWLAKQPEQRMIRLLNLESGMVGRAFLSQRYRPLDNFDLMVNVVPKLIEGGIQIQSSEVTENRLFIQGILPRIESEVKVGDVVQSGLIIKNSEVGCGSLTIQPLIYRLACKNGMILPDAGIRRYHVGKKLGDGEEQNFELFSDETRSKMDTAFWGQVNDIVGSTLREDLFKANVEKLKDASERQIGEPVKAMEVTRKTFGLNENEAADIMTNLINGADLSVWGMANAVTAAANDAQDYERAIELEEFGGRIIELPQTIWKN